MKAPPSICNEAWRTGRMPMISRKWCHFARKKPGTMQKLSNDTGSGRKSRLQEGCNDFKTDPGFKTVLFEKTRTNGRNI